MCSSFLEECGIKYLGYNRAKLRNTHVFRQTTYAQHVTCICYGPVFFDKIQVTHLQDSQCLSAIKLTNYKDSH